MNLPLREPSENSLISDAAWNSGPMVGGPDHDIVAAAVLALSAFGGDMDEETAEKLLQMWKRRHELSADQLVAVLDVFEGRR
jgi:hypothetical protein